MPAAVVATPLLLLARLLLPARCCHQTRTQSTSMSAG